MAIVEYVLPMKRINSAEDMRRFLSHLDITKLENSRAEKLRPDGYREFTNYEKYIFNRVNPHIFFRILDTSFTYSWLEAKELNLTYEDPYFRELCDTNRAAAIREVYGMVRKWESQGKQGDIGYTPLTEEQMVDHIRKTLEP